MRLCIYMDTLYHIIILGTSRKYKYNEKEETMNNDI